MYICIKCEFNTTRKIDIAKHIIEHNLNISTLKLSKCDFCKHKFTDQHKYTKHLKPCITKNISPAKIAKKIPKNKINDDVNKDIKYIKDVKGIKDVTDDKDVKDIKNNKDDNLTKIRNVDIKDKDEIRRLIGIDEDLDEEEEKYFEKLRNTDFKYFQDYKSDHDIVQDLIYHQSKGQLHIFLGDIIIKEYQRLNPDAKPNTSPPFKHIKSYKFV